MSTNLWLSEMAKMLIIIHLLDVKLTKSKHVLEAPSFWIEKIAGIIYMYPETPSPLLKALCTYVIDPPLPGAGRMHPTPAPCTEAPAWWLRNV